MLQPAMLYRCGFDVQLVFVHECVDPGDYIKWNSSGHKLVIGQCKRQHHNLVGRSANVKWGCSSCEARVSS